MDKPNFKKLMRLNIQALTNFPYIEEDFDALTNYELLCKIVEELNKVSDNQKILDNNITLLITAFNELKNYVDNYFENLDVQEEINNKLDEMVEQGVLQEIITEYLQINGVLAFDTVADMKIATNLVNGSICRTLGYHSINDEGGSLYKVRQITNEDTVNEMDIIALSDVNLIAEFIPSFQVNINQFGAYSDEVHDDSDVYQFAINYAYNKNIKLIGNRNYSLISKTLLIPVPINIEHLYLKAGDDISGFTNSYMVYINTTDGSNWVKSYNSFTDNRIEDIKLYNSNPSNTLNGIMSIANIQIKNIYSYALDRTFNSNTNKYVDAVQMQNIMISNKTGSNYCIDIGFLGDLTTISDGHIYDTRGDNYFIRFNGAHRPSKIENIINGIISVNYGNISINNYHGEGEGKSYILLNNGSFSLDTINVTDNKPCIRLDNAKASVNNFTSLYNYDNTYTTDNDITLSNNSELILTNSYKDVTVSGSATERLYSKIKTNVNDLNYINNENISNFNNEIKNTQSFIISSTYLSSGLREISTGTWKLASGTYYYKLCPQYDKDRLIRSNYVDSRNITLGENAHAVQFDGMPRNVPVRILRGTSNNSFTHYIDIIPVDNVLRDNGNIMNGKLWSEFSEPVTGHDGNTGFTEVSYKGNNVIAKRSSAPGEGTWNVGDIVLNNTPTANSPVGWICVSAGTPGTWKSISTIES